MPKLKSHRGARKRFKKSATGKILRRRATARHILTTKSRQRKRNLRRQAVVPHGEAQRIERMLL